MRLVPICDWFDPNASVITSMCLKSKNEHLNITMFSNASENIVIVRHLKTLSSSLENIVTLMF